MVNALSLCSLLILSLSVSASLSHDARPVHRRADVAHRRAVGASSDTSLLAKRNDLPSTPARRNVNKRCKARSTTTAAATTSASVSTSEVPSSTPEPVTTTARESTSTRPATTVAPGNVGGDPVTTSKEPETTTEKPSTRIQTVTTKAEETTPSPKTTSKANPATTAKESAPTTSASSGSGGGSSLLSGTKSGQGTFYGTGLNACGGTDKDTDMIAAVSHILFDEFPGATANPNDNPICGRTVTAFRGGSSVTVKITDRCTGCAEWDLDFSPSAFDKLADADLGRVDITWIWV